MNRIKIEWQKDGKKQTNLNERNRQQVTLKLSFLEFSKFFFFLLFVGVFFILKIFCLAFDIILFDAAIFLLFIHKLILCLKERAHVCDDVSECDDEVAIFV
jgi:hypothetical protein